MNQHTIKKNVSLSGTGLHSGQKTTITFKPAEEGAGVNFIRTDQRNAPRVKAELKSVTGTERGTNLGIVNTVEHVLSALYALSITNVEVELDGPEPPAADGSSLVYFDLLRTAGLTRQKARDRVINLREPIMLADNDGAIVAMPHNRLVIGFMINYPFDFIGSQYYKFEFSENGYKKEIAPARTYGFIRELDALKAKGLAGGAGEDNAVIIGDEGYRNPLRFPDELVRHKILDVIGDLSILNAEIKANIVCVRTGHRMNMELARKFKEVG